MSEFNPADLADDLESHYEGSFEFEMALTKTIELLRELAERPEPKLERRKGWLMAGRILVTGAVPGPDGGLDFGTFHIRTNYGHSPWVPEQPEREK